ncbi:MAG: hypothetical protein ACKO3T_17200 [Planctomycetaceae bacterium]
MRLSKLPQTIAISEERLQADVSVDWLNKYADVIRIRIDDSQLTGGNLPVDAHAVIARKACDVAQSRNFGPLTSQIEYSTSHSRGPGPDQLKLASRARQTSEWIESLSFRKPQE